jgi:mannosyltransferase OCH1-like enzyme
MIQKIIHQIWFQGYNNIPDKYKYLSNTWKRNNPKYKFMFWDQKKIEDLIKKEYNWFWDIYSSYEYMIQKIDAAKYFIIDKYGGLYVDMDCESVKPIDDIIGDFNIVVVKASRSPLEKIMGKLSTGREDVYQNGFFAGAAGHQLWVILFDELVKRNYKKGKFDLQPTYIFNTTGPTILTNALLKYGLNNKDVKVVPDGLVDPVSWCDYGNVCDLYTCKNKYKDAYTIHHYGSKDSDHSWNTHKNIAALFCKYEKMIIPSSVICCILCILIIIFGHKNILF